MKDFYHTIQSPAIAEQNIQRSRFIGYCYPVSSAEEALERISELRKEHYSATHVCWAYSIYGDEAYETRSNDDGEPSGTAGKPILGRLISRDLTNVAVAVVRYFGGVKLGTSGLIDAYRSTTELVLDKAIVREVILYSSVTLSFQMDLMGPVMLLVKNHGAEIVAQDYTSQYHLTVQLRRGDMPSFVAATGEIYGVTLQEEGIAE